MTEFQFYAFMLSLIWVPGIMLIILFIKSEIEFWGKKK